MEGVVYKALRGNFEHCYPTLCRITFQSIADSRTKTCTLPNQYEWDTGELVSDLSQNKRQDIDEFTGN